MNVIHYVVLATCLINLSAGKKLDLNYEIKFSKDPSYSNSPRCCPSGMSNSGKCIGPNNQEIDINLTCPFQRAIVGNGINEKLTISRHGELYSTDEDTKTKTNITNVYTKYCIDEMRNKTIGVVCGEIPDALFTIYINPLSKSISGIIFFLFCRSYLASSWRKTYSIMVYTIMTGIEYIMIGVNIWYANGQLKLNRESFIDNLTVYVMLSSQFCLLIMIAKNVGVFKHSNAKYIIIAFIIPFIIVLGTVLTELKIETVINFVVFIVMFIIFLVFVVPCFINVIRQEIQIYNLILECFVIFVIRSVNFCFFGTIPWIATLDSMLGTIFFILFRNKFKCITLPA